MELAEPLFGKKTFDEKLQRKIIKLLEELTILECDDVSASELNCNASRCSSIFAPERFGDRCIGTIRPRRNACAELETGTCISYTIWFTHMNMLRTMATIN